MNKNIREIIYCPLNSLIQREIIITQYGNDEKALFRYNGCDYCCGDEKCYKCINDINHQYNNTQHQSN